MDQIRRGERIPRTIDEWMVLVNLNIERQRKWLYPIIPWANNEGTHPSHNVGSNKEKTECHFTDVPNHLSHMSLEDGVLRKVNDNSMSWKEHALIHDAPREEFSLNNLSIFQGKSHAITSAIGDDLSLLYPKTSIVSLFPISYLLVKKV